MTDKPVFISRCPYLIVLFMILIYVALWLFYYPKYISTSDESMYIKQALAFSHVKVSLNHLDLATWSQIGLIPSTSPPGTAALITPFLMLGNWKLIFIMPLLCQLLTVLLIAWVLRREGLSPLFALLFLTYPVALAFGRMVMSDMPNMLFLTASLAVFWVGSKDPARPGMLFWAGVLAGLSLAVRHTNVLVLAPFFLSYVLRQQPGWRSLVVGGLIGCLPRFLFYWAVWGTPLYFESVPQGFSFFRFNEHLAFYGLSLNFLLPGLPFLLLFYRGRYRWELYAAFLIYFLFFCYFEGGAHATAFKKRMILANRYMLPLAPLLIWAGAEPLSRWAARLNSNRRRVLAGVLLMLIIPYWVMLLDIHEAWSARRAKVRQLIYENTLPGSIIIHNSENTRKYLLPVGELRHQYSWREVDDQGLLNANKHGVPLFTAFILRRDRGWHNACAREFLNNLKAICSLIPVLTVQVGDERLEISRVEGYRGDLQPVSRPECYQTTPPLTWRPD